MNHCEICGRQAYLTPRLSMLDNHEYDICVCCHLNRAESWRAFANTVSEARPGSWSRIPAVIKESVTVWINETYVPALEGAKQMLRQQMTVMPEEEPEERQEDEDDVPQAISDAQRRIRETLDQAEELHRLRQRAKPRWFLISTLSSIWGWIFHARPYQKCDWPVQS